jgi:asparagine synthase (glutamine-hydrolysing)
MCGITGIVNKDKTKVTFETIKTHTDIIAHRGPDGEGFLNEQNFALGHRRLAIIDVSVDGNQPMHLDRKYSIVFNGEIYNYLEVKAELKDLNYQFKTKSDTEVILTAYECWGFDCVNKFNGMWAFCIYDRTKNILFCSRDRFGVKPFYYFNDNSHFAFGSEIKQLLDFTDCSVNLNVLLNFLVLQTEETTDETFFNGIKRLPPSHNLIYNLETDEIKFEKYYTLNHKPHVADLSLEETKELCKSDLIKSIELRLRSDVNIGTCLSGGLDSSTIAAIAAKEFKLGSNFKGIHAKSTEKYTDESDFAHIVAKSGGINLLTIEPTEEYFLSNIEKVTRIQEEPYGGPSIFMQYAVFEKAKDAGCIVMLDGQGGDETLLGYERYFLALLKDKSFFSKISQMYKYSKKSRLSFVKVIAYYLYFKYPKIRIYRLFKKYNFIKQEYLNSIDTQILFDLAKAYDTPFDLQKLEITRSQLPPLLRYEDKNSMANSIESRLPFLDYRFVENAISYNPTFKINDGWSKFILRKATEDYLPKEVGWRRNKRGFESPRNWINNQDLFMPVIRESKILEKITNKIDSNLSNDIIWRLFSIAIWEKEFNVKLSK